jgi:hypothetical protein
VFLPISNGNDVSDKVRRLLAVTMAVESLLVIGLTLRDFWLGGTLTATIGAVTLLAISAVGVWATYATWVQHDSWLGASLLGQFSIAVLAGYTVLTAVRSPFPQFLDLDWSKKSPLIPLRAAGFAGILGMIAIFWVFYLVRHWRGPISAGMKTIVALIPLVGFVQFWLQTDYLPRTSLPLVDVTTDLTPMGKRGETVQLDAKVTINNRSSVPVYVGATMMRITAYPQATGTPTKLPDAIQFGLTPLHEYRDDPLIEQGKTLYASELLSVADVMAAGVSHTYSKVVDFDSGTMRLARLDVDGIFMTSPNIDEVYTCPVPSKETKVTWFHYDHPHHGEFTRILPDRTQVSADDKVGGFQDEIADPIYEMDADGVLKKFFCREIRLKPRNVIHEIVGDQPRFEVLAIFNDPTNPTLPYPALFLSPGVNGKYPLNARESQKVSAANPTLAYKNIGAQYSPSKEPALPLGGTPSTTPPSSTTPPPSTLPNRP